MGLLNTTGQISMGGATSGESMNLALGVSATAQITINSNPVTALKANSSVINTIIPSNFWGKSAPTIRTLFAFGNTVTGVTGTPTSISNKMDFTGTIAANTTGVGTARNNTAACSYGFDKGIFGFGFAAAASGLTNLVSNAGVVATDTAAVGTARQGVAAVSYGFDKGIFYGGFSTVITTTSNLVSNTGVVATNVTSSGTARMGLTGVPYGFNLGVFAYGQSTSLGGTFYGVSNKVSSAGVIATDTGAVAVNRGYPAGSGYGYDKGIYVLGNASGTVNATSNLVSNTGTVAGTTAAVSGVTARLGASGGTYGYGGAAKIFAGNTGAAVLSVTNAISSSGVVSADSTTTGTTAKQRGGACGYSITA